MNDCIGNVQRSMTINAFTMIDHDAHSTPTSIPPPSTPAHGRTRRPPGYVRAGAPRYLHRRGLTGYARAGAPRYLHRRGLTGDVSAGAPRSGLRSFVGLRIGPCLDFIPRNLKAANSPLEAQKTRISASWKLKNKEFLSPEAQKTKISMKIFDF